MKGNIISREDALRMAHSLISAPKYDHETDARARGWLSLAERLPASPDKPTIDTRARQACERFLRYGHETRDLGEGSPVQTAQTSVLVQQGFAEALLFALRQVDRLFDPDVVTFLTTETGAPTNLPFINDVDQAAVQISENAQDPTGVEGVMSGDPTLLCQVPTAQKWISKMIRVSIELATDTGFDIVDFLTKSFAIRLARGLGASLTSSLLSAAIVGATAVGSSANTGGSEDGSTSVGLADLAALIESVDPSYRAVGAWFLMNAQTLLKLDSVVSKSGLPMLSQTYNADGEREILGYPVAICPSMPNVGASATPIAFGATRYWTTRLVKKETACNVYMERYAEYLQRGYTARLRGSGVLMGNVTRATSPVTYEGAVKLLQNAAS